MKLNTLSDDPWDNDFRSSRPTLFVESLLNVGQVLPSIPLAINKYANDNNIKLILIGANAANAYTGKSRST